MQNGNCWHVATQPTSQQIASVAIDVSASAESTANEKKSLAHKINTSSTANSGAGSLVHTRMGQRFVELLDVENIKNWSNFTFRNKNVAFASFQDVTLHQEFLFPAPCRSVTPTEDRQM